MVRFEDILRDAFNDEEVLQGYLDAQKEYLEKELKENLEEETPKYKIFYRWNAKERLYEVWAKDVDRKDYPEVYHNWVNKNELDNELKRLTRQFHARYPRF